MTTTRHLLPALPVPSTSPPTTGPTYGEWIDALLPAIDAALPFFAAAGTAADVFNETAVAALTDDTTEIQQLLDGTAAASPNGGGVADLGDGAHGVRASLLVDNGVKVKARGAGSYLVALDGHTGGGILKNKHTDGTQQDFQTEDLTIYGRQNHGVAAGQGIVADSVFVGTAIRRVKALYCSGPALHLRAMGTTGCGAVDVEEFVASHCADDNILAEGAVGNVSWRHIDSERPLAGKACMHLLGKVAAPAPQVSHMIDQLYMEVDQANQGCLLIEDCSNVTGRVIQPTPTTGILTGQYGVRITGQPSGLVNNNMAACITLQQLMTSAGAGLLMIDDQPRGVSALSGVDGRPLINSQPVDFYTTNGLATAGQVIAGSLHTKVPGGADLFDLNTAGNVTMLGSYNLGLYAYPGDPNSHVAANAGSLCVGDPTGPWYKATGSGNTGWTHITVP